MKHIILVFSLLFTSTALLAQDAQQRIETTLGKLVIENATLASTIENLNKQIADLKKQLEDKGK